MRTGTSIACIRGVERSVAFAVQHAARAVDLDGELDALASVLLGQAMADVMNRRGGAHVFLLEQFPDLRRRDFLAARVGEALHSRV